MKKMYDGKTPIGVYAYTAFSGFLVMDSIHEFDDYLVTCYEISGKRGRYVKNKVFTNQKGDYIRKGNDRIYLSEIMRTNYPD